MDTFRPAQRNRLLTAVMAAVVFGLVLTCYWPALHGGLLWDDAAHVTQPDLVSWRGLGRIWTDLRATQQYYPVLHSAFWLEHRLWGDATPGYHLVNVAQHAIACVLLALLVQRLAAGRLLSEASVGDGARAPQLAAEARAVVAGWAAAVLFAVHPVMVESVAWISEQKNTLSLLFYLGAALAYLRFTRTRSWQAYASASVLFLLALGTKSVTATLPAALLVMRWWQHGRLRWKADIVPLLPWFGAAMVSGLFTAWVEQTLIGAKGEAFDLTFVERLLLAGRVIWFYLGKLLWPSELIFIYPRWNISIEAPGWAVWLVAALAVTAVLWWIRRRTRTPLAAWLFFAGSLFPALGFFNVFPFLFSYVADHFQYLPSVGMMVAAGAAVAAVWVRLGGPGRAFVGAVFGAVVVLLAVRSRAQSRAYRDSETLYRTTLALNSNAWMAHSNLGVELSRSPEHVAEALRHYEQALALKPDSSEAHNNYGNALSTIPGRQEEAIAHFERALQIYPEFLEARLNLANTLATLPARAVEALPHYEAVLRTNPDFAEAHFAYATALAARPNRQDEAVREFTTAIALRPDYAEAHGGLALLLQSMPARTADAIAQFETSLRIAPNLAVTHYNYGLLLEGLPGREADAIAHYSEAVRLNPGYVGAHNNLGVLHAQQGRFDLAREQWEAVLRIQPDDEDARRNLARLNQLERR